MYSVIKKTKIALKRGNLQFLTSINKI